MVFIKRIDFRIIVLALLGAVMLLITGYFNTTLHAKEHINDSSTVDAGLVILDEESGDITQVDYDSLKERDEAYDYYVENGYEVEVDEVYFIAENSDYSFGVANGSGKNTDLSYKNIKATGEDVTVAVIDTGYTYERSGEYDQSRILPGVDFTEENTVRDYHGHGTAIVNLIRDYTGEYVKILPLKVADSNGRASLSDIYRAIEFAIEEKVDIINISMSAYKPFESKLLNEIIGEAYENGIAVVAAAGNNSSDVCDYSPGNCPEAVTVGACETDKSRSAYSNYGETIDLYSCGMYGDLKGTSVSAAYVSILYAEIMFMKPEISLDEIYQLAVSGIDLDGENQSPDAKKIFLVDSINNIFESTVCDSADIFKTDIYTIDKESLDELIGFTPEITLRQYLLSLTDAERELLLEKGSLFGSVDTDYVVYETVCEGEPLGDESLSGVKVYDSYMHYLLEKEFEPQWYCSSATKTGYFYIEYNDSSNNKKYRQKIQVKLKNLPTSNGNSKASVTVSDFEEPKSGAVGYTLTKAEVTKGLETNYVYLGLKFKLNLGDVEHYRLTAGKNASSIDESNGGGGVISIDDKASIECCGEKKKIDEVVFQISFHNVGISITGSAADTGYHGVMYVKGEKCSQSYVYSTSGSFKNGKRTRTCDGCKEKGKVEYLNYILLQRQKSDGTFTDDLSDSDYCKKLNMDGSTFKEKYDGNYYAEGKSIPACTVTYGESVYLTGTLAALKAKGSPKENDLKINRKKYKINFIGNGATSGSMDYKEYYFNQSMALSANSFKRSYKVSFDANGGTFSDGKSVNVQNVDYTFDKWATSKDGSGITYADKEKVKNVIIAGTSKTIGSMKDGLSANLYAMWKNKAVTFPKNLSKAGYKFKGWSKVKNDSSGLLNSFIPASDTTLYALWEPDVVEISLESGILEADKGHKGTEKIYEHVSVGYYFDSKLKKNIGGSSIDVPDRQMKDSIECYIASKKSDYGIVTENVKSKKDIFRPQRFCGYYTEKNGRGYEVCDKNGRMIKNINKAGDYRYYTAPGKAYADWENEHVLLYDAGLTREDPLTEEQVILPDMIAATPENPTYADLYEPIVTDDYLSYIYRFKGWSTDCFGADMLSDSEPYSFDGLKDIVLYANWEMPLGIRYHSNGAEGEDYCDKGVLLYKDVALPDKNEFGFAMEGAAFVGWSLSEEDGEIYGDDEQINVNELFNKAYKEGLLDKQDECTYIDLYAVWDYYPVIEAYDGWFAIEEGYGLNEDILFEKMKVEAVDKEAITGKNPKGLLDKWDSLRIIDFDSKAVEAYAKAGKDFAVSITYEAVDSGENVVTTDVMLHFVSGEPKDVAFGRRIRFISSKYINTLGENSIWKEEPYMEVLEKALKKTMDNKRAPLAEYDVTKKK